MHRISHEKVEISMFCCIRFGMIIICLVGTHIVIDEQILYEYVDIHIRNASDKNPKPLRFIFLAASTDQQWLNLEFQDNYPFKINVFFCISPKQYSTDVHVCERVFVFYIRMTIDTRVCFIVRLCLVFTNQTPKDLQ